MKLQHVQRYGIERFIQFTGTGIDEQPHRCHKRWQARNDCPRLLRRYRPRTFFVEHKAKRVSPGGNRCQCIVHAGNTADLAANG